MFKALASRVRVLLENLNGKLLDQRIRVDRESGLVVETAAGAEPIELSWLSSGEQHQLVVQYELLFRVQENTRVLVDEPELSLHVDWQRRFLPEFIGIVTAARLDGLLATHSPSLAGAAAELMVALEAAPELAGSAHVSTDSDLATS